MATEDGRPRVRVADGVADDAQQASSPTSPSSSSGSSYVVPPELVEAFKRDGVVVLPGVFTESEVARARAGLAATLRRHGVDVDNLEETAGNLRKLSSTGGSGGVLDVYYPHWKLELAQSPRFFGAISQLWAATFARPAAAHAREEDARVYASQPHGAFDAARGFFYLDRVGFRVPDRVGAMHGKGRRPLQRSLAPHLDCCPAALHDSGKAHPRWRPIQSLIALTDNDRPDLGGFECVRSFHREFDGWARARPPCGKTGRPPPCVGDFTPIRPVEDGEVIQRFAPVFYRAGDVVAFDYRIPHANAAMHQGTVPRQCAYGSFLPDVPVNRAYAARQRERYLDGRRQPDDQWKEGDGKEEPWEDEPLFDFSELGWALLGGRGGGGGQ